MKRNLVLLRFAAAALAVTFAGCAVDYGLESDDGEETAVESIGAEQSDPADPSAQPGGAEGAGGASQDDKADDGAAGSSTYVSAPGGSEEVVKCSGATEGAMCPMASKSGAMSHGDPIPWKESDNR